MKDAEILKSIIAAGLCPVTNCGKCMKLLNVKDCPVLLASKNERRDFVNRAVDTNVFSVFDDIQAEDLMRVIGEL